MERVFTQDILAGDRVRFGAGEARDYPKDVWGQIAVSAGKDLDEFTTSVEEAARRGVEAIQATLAEPSADEPEVEVEEIEADEEVAEVSASADVQDDADEPEDPAPKASKKKSSRKKLEK